MLLCNIYPTAWSEWNPSFRIFVRIEPLELLLEVALKIKVDMTPTHRRQLTSLICRGSYY